MKYGDIQHLEDDIHKFIESVKNTIENSSIRLDFTYEEPLNGWIADEPVLWSGNAEEFDSLQVKFEERRDEMTARDFCALAALQMSCAFNLVKRGSITLGLLKEAIRLGNVDALTYLYHFQKDANNTRNNDLLKKAVALGSFSAALNVIDCLFAGLHGFEKNVDKANEMVEEWLIRMKDNEKCRLDITDIRYFHEVNPDESADESDSDHRLVWAAE